MKAKKLLAIICTILFGVSLLQNVFVFQSGDSSFIMGFVCLLFGWTHIQWLANPLIAASHFFLFRGKYGWSVLCSAVAVMLALSAFSIKEVPQDESGTMTLVLGFSSGFYLWLSVMLVTFGEGLIFLIKDQKKPNQ
jgi:hypothetical protein